VRTKFKQFAKMLQELPLCNIFDVLMLKANKNLRRRKSQRLHNIRLLIIYDQRIQQQPLDK